jgi:CBS domain containing-hemolysin-like protein
MNMLNFILGLLLAAGSIVLLVLWRTYLHVPTKELKRLSRDGDEVAQLLYRAAAYGMSLQVLLVGGTVVFAAGSLICLANALGVALAVLVLLVLLVVGGFALVPSSELTRTSLLLARKAAPGIAWILERSQPVFGRLGRLARRYRHVQVHTGLYEKSDFVDLLERQKGQPDSRIAPSEVNLLQHALSFGEEQVADALTPKRVMKTVSASDAIGPLLMTDLHTSGHSRFPVYEGETDNIVGILYLHDLVGARQTGTVADVMSRKLTYVHENFTLQHSLQVFLKTKQHLFLVVNSFEELVGILTIEDVLEHMIGRQIVDEFDRYDDLRAVAAAAAAKEHKAHKEAEPEVEPTPETSEVIQ